MRKSVIVGGMVAAVVLAAPALAGDSQEQSTNQSVQTTTSSGERGRGSSRTVVRTEVRVRRRGRCRVRVVRLVVVDGRVIRRSARTRRC